MTGRQSYVDGRLGGPVGVVPAVRGGSMAIPPCQSGHLWVKLTAASRYVVNPLNLNAHTLYRMLAAVKSM